MNFYLGNKKKSYGTKSDKIVTEYEGVVRESERGER